MNVPCTFKANHVFTSYELFQALVVTWLGLSLEGILSYDSEINHPFEKKYSVELKVQVAVRVYWLTKDKGKVLRRF